MLPGVEVTATQTATSISRQAVSDERGNFALTNLPVGPYKVEAALPGFRTFVQTGIELGVNQNPNLPITLEVGQVNQEVEVQANVTMVETRNLGVRQVIENQEVLDLPLQSRNATDFLTLLGGAVADTANNSSTRSLQGGIGISITGLLEGSTTFTLDGAHSYEYIRQPESAYSVSGCASGIQSPDRRSEFFEWLSGWSSSRRGDEVGHQQLSWRRV